jgi:uroporphyrinogen-III synthase
MLVFGVGDRKGLGRSARKARAGLYDWVFFTSATGVSAAARMRGFFRAFAKAGIGIGAVGPATAQALRAAGCRVHLVPERHTSAALAAAWRRRAGPGARGARILLLQPDIAPNDLERGLKRHGAVVDRVTAYRTRGAETLPRPIPRLARSGRIDWVTFASPSAAGRLARLLARAGVPPRAIPAASIGPTTTRAARCLGFRVLAESPDQTDAGLVREMEKKIAAPVGARR